MSRPQTPPQKEYKLPLRLNVVGPCESGKTSYLRMLLDRKVGPVGRRVATIISVGCELDARDYDFADQIIPADSECVRAILKAQMGKDPSQRRPLLLLFDDLTGNGWAPNGRDAELFKWFSVQSRHYDISFILVCQYLFVLSPLLRENATMVTVTSNHCSRRQLNSLAENLPVAHEDFNRLMRGVEIGVVLEIPVSGAQEPRLLRVPEIFATKGA